VLHRRGRGLLGETGLVIGREVRERVRGRTFRVVTAILAVAVAAAVVIPALHGNSTGSERVAVVGSSPSLDAQLRALARTAGVSVVLVPERDAATALRALRAGHVDLVVEASGPLTIDKPVSATDTSKPAQYVRALSLALGAQRAFASAGLTPAQVATVAHARAVPVHSVHPGKTRTPALATALLGVILVFVVLTQYLTWTLMGVMEEKASRVVEVLLATLRPLQLLAGKVLGIGLVALAQAIGLVSLALGLGAAVGSSLLDGAAPLVVVADLVWLVLGYAFYSWLYAAGGSLAERQDQVQSLALPLAAPLIFGYIVSLTGASSGSASVLMEVLAYLPPTAPFAMPVLVGLGAVSWWQFTLSALFAIAATGAVAVAAARVYRGAVLRTGRRVRLREVVPFWSR
jgi:ABC-2 type transport system permease protein